MKNTIKYLTLAACVGLMSERSSAALTSVGLELSLLVDVSDSVNAAEWALQRNGYVAAFQSSAVHNAITALAAQNGGNGVAVSYIQWSTSQQLSVGWTLLNNAADANAFAAAILAAPRPFNLATGIGDALKFSADSTFSNIYDSARQVIDVSGDGESNVGSSAASGRAYAVGLGIDTINGLPIGGASLVSYYQNNVQHGAGSFTLAVNSFDDFAPTIERKLLAEITNTPPGTKVPEGGPGLVLSGVLLLGLAGLRKKFSIRSAN